MSIFEIPKGYALTRQERHPVTTLRPYECADCGWQGHAEMTWDGERFTHVSDCPVHPGSPLDEWA